MRRLAAQTEAEVGMTLRRGESLLLTLGIPVVLLVFFSQVHLLPTGTTHPVTFLAPGVLALAVMGTAMVNLSIATGFERGYGVLKRLGATPLGRPSLLGAKIASIGMYEHIGLANIPAYMARVRGMLANGGLFLNHAISSRAKRKRRRFGVRPEKKAIQKYIFPGGELDDIGHSVSAMEQAGFEVHDVEAWRWHYAHTTRLWCERLYRNRAKAEAIVGAQTTRIWLAYLAGCSLAFERATIFVFQTLASKRAKGQPPLPPTREDLYGPSLRDRRLPGHLP